MEGEGARVGIVGRGTETGVSFSGHESFPLRYGWPKKCVDAVAESADVFAHDDAMVVLGVGKNMVKAIRHWGLTTRVIEIDPNASKGRGQGLRVSALGEMIFGSRGSDPYLEDPRTLWLLHWLISTHREKATTWSWAFGSLNRQAFSRDELLRDLQATALSSRTTVSSLTRDVEVFLRTYVPARATRSVAVEDTLDCPLVELRLLREDPTEHRYEFVRGPKPSLDHVMLGFALLEFWHRVAPDRDTLSFDEIVHRHGSPGRVFKLDDASLVERLEDIARWSHGALLHDETAGVRQLLRRKRVDPLVWLRHELGAGRVG
jgi:hypothetical protein